jgi:enabled protein
MPVHESQAIPDTPTGPAQPLSPTVPSKPVRLGGAIAAADMHIVREAKPSMPGPNATAGFFPLKMTAGPRKVPPPVPHKGGITGQDPKLAAILAKKREWEPVEEDAAPVLPSQSASKAQPPSPPVRSASAEARRLAKEDFDKGRMTGWKKDEE